MKNKTMLYGFIGLFVLIATATGVFYQTPGAHIEYVTVSQLGLPVIKIIRVCIGSLHLGSLKPREWRYLDVISTFKEVIACRLTW